MASGAVTEARQLRAARLGWPAKSHAQPSRQAGQFQPRRAVRKAASPADQCVCGNSEGVSIFSVRHRIVPNKRLETNLPSLAVELGPVDPPISRPKAGTDLQGRPQDTYKPQSSKNSQNKLPTARLPSEAYLAP